jgi:GNAT superfamily N-acetyltransferase
MNGPVTAAKLDETEAFYRARGAPCSIELSPMADFSVPDLLTRRGYAITEFANLLIRSMAALAETPSAGVQVIEAQSDEGEAWASVAARGFFEREEASEGELEIGQAIFHAPSARAFFAALDQQHAGVGAMAAAVLFADSTLPRFRGRGVQLALIGARLAAARTAGAELAIASTAPGSISQRNYQRCGFEPAYTRITFQKS